MVTFFFFRMRHSLHAQWAMVNLSGSSAGPRSVCGFRAIIAPLSLLVGRPPFGVWSRLPFCIFRLQGDGNLHFVEALPTLDEAKARVRELGEIWPGEYGIENVETGERVLVSTRDETKN